MQKEDIAKGPYSHGAHLTSLLEHEQLLQDPGSAGLITSYGNPLNNLSHIMWQIDTKMRDNPEMERAYMDILGDYLTVAPRFLTLMAITPSWGYSRVK